MNEKMKALIGRNHEELEKELGFTHYLETKDFEDFRKLDIDHNILVDVFLHFNSGNALSIVIFYDGVIQNFLSLKSEEIIRELRLLKDNRGIFSSPDDEELATSVGLFTNEYLAEFMQGIIFFSGKKESVEKFSSILDNFGIKHFPPNLIPNSRKIKLNDTNLLSSKFKLRKLGRNEPCHCGSGIKYKKCCLESDIEETGKPKKV